MIAALRGKILIKDTQYCILDVAGVGYKVYLSSAVLSKIAKDQTVQLFTYNHVREDMLDLYGFMEFAELKLFELLIGVSGIGPKTVLNIFAIGSKDDIVNAIMRADDSFFTGVPRLGKKNAQKIIIELKGKLGSTAELELSEDGGDNQDVILALQSFGFSRAEAQEAVRSLDQKAELTAEEKVKLALKYLGK